PATRRPGDPATRRPGDPATRRPGDPALYPERQLRKSSAKRRTSVPARSPSSRETPPHRRSTWSSGSSRRLRTCRPAWHPVRRALLPSVACSDFAYRKPQPPGAQGNNRSRLRVNGDPLAAVRCPDIAGKGDCDTNARRRALAVTGDESIDDSADSTADRTVRRDAKPGAAGPVIARGRRADSADGCRVGPPAFPGASASSQQPAHRDLGCRSFAARLDLGKGPCEPPRH
ncbi:MAG: hypothetical protein F4Y62_02490, partial [Rhodospirillaceae bacterium]|nr:hypothetical protein [Rhodospirillaceae bacterium]